ncbi:type II secretion system protein GspN [Deferrisoma camini]|uniref:type II secretion system protein GspN n=1 Tax=Deferrisoma camini TaxID=1035120 RepID=UPI00046D697C|nr:type II secretion system protein GspN [Deferrisoma camini]
MAAKTGRVVGRVVAYALVFLTAFGVSLWRSLPYDEIASAVETRLRDRGVSVRVRGLGPGPWFGVRAGSVQVEPPGLPVRLGVSDLEVWPSWARALRGRPALRFRATVAGGTVEGEVGSYGRVPLDLSWTDVALGEIPKPPPWKELPLVGRTGGSLSVDGLRQSPFEARARLQASFSGVRIGPGKVRGVPVPAVGLGDGVLEVDLEGGRAEVREARFRGGDLEVLLTGAAVDLRRPLGRSPIKGGLLSLTPNQKVQEDLALLFALFPGSRGSDGRYTARIRGTLQAPRLLRR